MRALATLCTAADVHPLRERHRREMDCQIVHDSIHRRDGWTRTYACSLGGHVAGFASVAIGGPWKGAPTAFEFYVLPDHRGRTFDLFEAFLSTSGALFIEGQSNDPLLAVVLHACASDVRSESIVFRDGVTTALPPLGAEVHRITSDEDGRTAIANRQGGVEWELRLGGETIGNGGLLFHYNVPYADLYMEIGEPWRRRGFGAYLVQEVKRLAYGLDAVPCARCNPANLASRRTLQRAGFVPCAHVLKGTIRPTR